jgi:hypothetical protein
VSAEAGAVEEIEEVIAGVALVVSVVASLAEA